MSAQEALGGPRRLQEAVECFTRPQEAPEGSFKRTEDVPGAPPGGYRRVQETLEAPGGPRMFHEPPRSPQEASGDTRGLQDASAGSSKF